MAKSKAAAVKVDEVDNLPPHTPANVPVLTHKYGTREQVWEGKAEKTRGGLSKPDLIYCERDKKIKSKKLSELARERARGVLK